MAKTAEAPSRREALRQQDLFGSLDDNVLKALDNDTIAVRLTTQGPTMRAGFKSDDKARVAEALEMTESRVRGGTQLVDTRHPAIENARNVISSMKDLMNRYGLPFPSEDGVRLIPLHVFDKWREEFDKLRPRLVEANQRLQEAYREIRDAARRECGSTWRESSFPSDLSFRAAVDYPNLTPPDYLAKLSPTAYAEARKGFEASLKDASDRFETMLLAELQDILATVVDRLQGEINTTPLVKQMRAAGLAVRGVEGQSAAKAKILWDENPSAEDLKIAQRFINAFEWAPKPKIFRENTIMKIFDVIPRFRDLNINNNAKLAELVDNIEQAFRNQVPRGKDASDLPKQLRSSQQAREALTGSLTSLLAVVEDHLQDRPQRRVIRGGFDLETGLPV